MCASFLALQHPFVFRVPGGHTAPACSDGLHVRSTHTVHMAPHLNRS